jgi:regulator of RNase E activity RraB
VKDVGKDHWDFYFCRVNDVPSSVFLNMDRRASAPDPRLPTLVWVWVPMRDPRADGLSSGSESPELDAIEKSLQEVLRREMSAELVGRITGGARREFYFYTPAEGPLSRLVNEALARHAGYEAEYYGQKPDPGWTQYLQLLYPRPRDRERMKSRWTLQALAANGDVPSIVRPIDHWLYFTQSDDRARVASTLQGGGFAVITQGVDEAGGERSFSLRVQRNAAAESDQLDVAVFEILDALEGVDGEYDGWEAPVMREAAKRGLLRGIFGRRT